MALMRSYNRQGASHKNGLRIGLKVGGSIEDGGLVEYFFGKDGKGSLPHDKFVQFLSNLHDEVLHLSIFTPLNILYSYDFQILSFFVSFLNLLLH